MTDNLKKFIEAVRENKQLAEQMKTLDGLEDRDKVMTKTIELAKQHGVELAEADFEEPEASKLSDSELESVSAAGGCGCAIGGYGSGDGLDCTCVATGWGDTGEVQDCFCQFAGAGWN